ncbi:uncharacterized protein AMSG_10350 [Thecamonas trahens ATCC 50062]|uniref:Uncharacterized protein n=1 Tax=Thecamonas trahens ATCC 50062 TaxID=461836 RepID=A0A0L0DQ11_THETB|nr:hypothetical protein AMSG_10350 [Thecamonas trahens ATCC 50062]KNC54355.1 hypothetical protein AMSG_10350 [Thecamonas trahens ATCC 50062]|eukprot:XP_013753809.1 hypothetical protein AMSG_10350 [Thecamonas trahens ATCC 50062]
MTILDCGENVCKITDVKLSRPGKHGHAKKFVTGKCVLTDRKFTEIFTHHSVFKYFTMANETYTVCDITDDDFLALMDIMDNDGEMREDVPLPDSDSLDADLGQRCR